MEIKPLFETTLSAPYQGKFLHPAGAKVAISHKTDTKRFGPLVWLAPNPVHLFLNSAEGAITEAREAAKQIHGSPQQVFSELVNSDPTIAAERALREDPKAELTTHPNAPHVYAYVEAAMKAQIFMAMAVEAFTNLMIPNDYKYNRTWKGKQEELGKDQIERKCSLEDKMDILATIKSLPEMKQQSFWSPFKELTSLRGDIVHWKTLGTPFLNYEATYVRLFEADMDTSLKAIIDLMNYVSPEFVA
jgi:hypothetical protein